MMDNLRAATNHVVFKIILGLIAVSFVLTGVGDYLIGGDGDYAAKVNGHQISRVQLELAVQNAHNRQQESIGKKFSKLTDNKGYMRQQVLSQLIDETLLDQYANKLGLAIVDDQIKQAIFAIPAFRTKDKFDNVKFRSLIGNMGLSPVQYAALMRKQLLTQQIIQGIVSTGFLLPGETEKLFALAVQTRDARLATFDIAALAAKQTSSDYEIQASYNAHKNKYLSPEAFKVSYIQMDAEAIQAKISVDEQEIQSWYDQHHNQFTVPARKRYSIIQSKTENEANDCLKQLQQGIDFAALAKAHSTDLVSAKNGGDIGWISDNLDELKQANLREKGQLSGVIKSFVGFLIVRLDDIASAQASPLSAVHDKVAAKVKKEKAIDAYYALQQKVSDAASNNNETLASAEAAAGIKVQETDWFSRDDVTETLNYDAVKQVLFDGTLLGSNGAPGSNSHVITVDGNRALVIRIADHRPEHVQPLEDVRARIEQEVKRKKAVEQARVYAQKALATLKQGNDKSAKALQSAGLRFSTAQHFDSANQSDPLAQAVFSLPKPPQGKSSYGIATNAQEDIVLIALDRVNPRLIDEQERKALVGQLNQEMTGVVFDALLANLRATAKIKMGAMGQMQ